jgi:ATP-dependent DNA helicase RecQ
MTPNEVLLKYWGYPNFRSIQPDIIQSVLDGRDTLALLPTGGGKSICFQVPAMCMEGICIVISPLIALMKDQVHNLKKRGIAAVAIFSGMSRREVDILFENACQGAYKFLYISPERLKTDMAIERIKRMKVCLVAVDEAHCISQWGYDFRPPYLDIAQLRPLLPKVPVMALTATATEPVIQDIQDRLAFGTNSQVFRISFQRTNLSYSVLYEVRKQDKMLDILRRVAGTGIVYVRSRGEAKHIAHYLQTHGIVADYYHAGLTQQERNARQEAWIEGRTRVMVCTNAFGMGIDKPDVRIVIHLMLPDNLEAYFQEAGRAGRDGQRAYTVLLYEPADAEKLRVLHAAAFPGMDLIRRVYQALGSYTQIAIGSGLGESFDFDLQDFCHKFKIEQHTAHVVLRLLEQEGWVTLSDAAAAPARLYIHSTREVLYDYQIRNKEADKVSKSVLRLYRGVQSDFVDISEVLIGQVSGLPHESVMQILRAADTAGILIYQPRNEHPQLVFTMPRVAAENLTIDTQKYEFRRKNAEIRLQKSIEYAEQRICRSQLLLTYFGETNSPACGVCDICTGRNAGASQDTQVLENYERKIRAVVLQHSMTLEEILEAFAPKRHATVIQTIEALVSEGILIEVEDGKLRFA